MSDNRMAYFGNDISGVALGISGEKVILGAKDKGPSENWVDLQINTKTLSIDGIVVVDGDLRNANGTSAFGGGTQYSSAKNIEVNKMRVFGDASFNQLVEMNSDLSANKVLIHGDLSANDASFNNIELLGDLIGNDASFNNLFIMKNLISSQWYIEEDGDISGNDVSFNNLVLLGDLNGNDANLNDVNLSKITIGNNTISGISPNGATSTSGIADSLTFSSNKSFYFNFGASDTCSLH